MTLARIAYAMAIFIMSTSQHSVEENSSDFCLLLIFIQFKDNNELLVKFFMEMAWNVLIFNWIQNSLK